MEKLKYVIIIADEKQTEAFSAIEKGWEMEE